jgi:N-acetylglucosaminyl-diphospho-decaprenol L-rhamnosyltransferase
MSAPVAVAVVSWNTRELLDACLRSLAPDAESGLVEVWVVDNRSEDGSPELVRDRFGWASLLEPDRNLGFGAAVNEVANRTNRPWLAAANADIAVAPGALERLLAAGEGDPNAGSLAPRLVLPDGTTQHAVHHFPTVGLSLAFNLGLTTAIPALGDRLCIDGRWDPDRERRVDWAHGAFLLLRRAAFEEVGGFDPRQWMYAEDIDLAWRLARAGWATRYVPDATVRHELSAATEQAFGDARLARFMGASYAWLLRRRGRAVTLAFGLVNLAGAAVRLAVLAPLARLRPGRAAAARRARAYAAAHLDGIRSALRASGGA